MDWTLPQKLRDQQAMLWLVQLGSCWKAAQISLGFSTIAQWHGHSNPHVLQPKVVGVFPIKMRSPAHVIKDLSV